MYIHTYTYTFAHTHTHTNTFFFVSKRTNKAEVDPEYRTCPQ